MEISMFVMAAIALVAGGVGMTVVVAKRMPVEVLERAQRHGRFAGLGTPDLKGGSGKALGLPAGAHPVGA